MLAAQLLCMGAFKHQWTYTLSPDPSGRRAAMYGTVQVAIRPSVVNSNLFPDFTNIL